MDGMGRHTNGTGLRGEDGAAAVATLEPFSIALAPQRLAPLPPSWTEPHQDEPVTMDGKRSFDGDRLRRASMWLLAAGVAAIAAIVSYSHIYDLGRAHGGSGVAARLLPLSVDMLILVGELMLLHEADKKGRRFVLGWTLVWSGILATLGANVTYGYQFGVLGAVIWGWPAYSFILAAGGMVAVVKRGAVRESEPCPETDKIVHREVGEPAPRELVAGMDKAPAKSMDKPPVKRVDKPQPRQVPPSADKVALSRAMDIIKSHPGITNAEVVRRAKVSVKTVTRARKELNGAKP